MSGTSDERRLERLEQYRMMALVVAIGLSIVSIVMDWEWLDWPRALAWTAGGVVSILEGRVLERLGHDARASYLRAALFFLVAVLCVV